MNIKPDSQWVTQQLEERQARFAKAQAYRSAINRHLKKTLPLLVVGAAACSVASQAITPGSLQLTQELEQARQSDFSNLEMHKQLSATRFSATVSPTMQNSNQVYLQWDGKQTAPATLEPADPSESRSSSVGNTRVGGHVFRTSHQLFPASLKLNTDYVPYGDAQYQCLDFSYVDADKARVNKMYKQLVDQPDCGYEYASGSGIPIQLWQQNVEDIMCSDD